MARYPVQPNPISLRESVLGSLQLEPDAIGMELLDDFDPLHSENAQPAAPKDNKADLEDNSASKQQPLSSIIEPSIHGVEVQEHDDLLPDVRSIKESMNSFKSSGKDKDGESSYPSQQRAPRDEAPVPSFVSKSNANAQNADFAAAFT